MGLDQGELEIIQSTRDLVLDRGEELTAEVYDHFLKFPETRRFFLSEDGDVNEERLERRKHSLMRWLRGSIDFKIDEDYPIRLLATGIVHSHPPSHRAPYGVHPQQVHDRQHLICADGAVSDPARGDGRPTGGPEGISGLEQNVDGPTRYPAGRLYQRDPDRGNGRGPGRT